MTTATAMAHHVGQESPPVMTYPLIALAGLRRRSAGIWSSAATGWFESPSGRDAGYRGALAEGSPRLRLGRRRSSARSPASAGSRLASCSYAEPSPIPARIASSIRPLYQASLNKFYIDELYDWTVMKVVIGAAVAVARCWTSTLVDRLVVGIAKTPGRLGRDVLAGYQNGLIQFYAAVSALSVVVLL